VSLPVAQYSYYHPATRGLDFAGFTAALRGAPEGSIILLHACAHNPTGVDPTRDQWKEIAVIMRERNLFPFFDCAYQGFASGDLDNDAWAVRYFVEQGFELCIAQSFSKNLGLYGERAGCFHFVSPPSEAAVDATVRIGSQLAIVQRSEISNPPAYGARIADKVLNDPVLFEEWKEQLRTMAGRIIDMRETLVQKLKELGTPGDWSHVIKQIGMFSFTGLTEAQVQRLREEAHIYMTKNGRISMVGF
jgi:aspartate aminotransferase